MASGRTRAWATPGLALSTDQGRGAIRSAAMVQSVDPELTVEEEQVSCEITVA